MKWKQNSIRIEGLNDVLKFHDILFGDDIAKNRSVSEWQCLLNILRKAHFSKAIPDLLVYPFIINKTEEPDFVLDYGVRALQMEITKITTQRIEDVRHKTEKTGDTDLGYEDSASLYQGSRPVKGENLHLIRQPGEPLVENGIYGAYPEKRWADICVEAIKKKSLLTYAKSVDYLILDDCDFPWNSPEYIVKRYEILREMIEDNDLKQLKMLPNIVANTCGSIGLIRIKNIWQVEAIELSSEWHT